MVGPSLVVGHPSQSDHLSVCVPDLHALDYVVRIGRWFLGCCALAGDRARFVIPFKRRSLLSARSRPGLPYTFHCVSTYQVVVGCCDTWSVLSRLQKLLQLVLMVIHPASALVVGCPFSEIREFTAVRLRAFIFGYACFTISSTVGSVSYLLLKLYWRHVR